MQVEIDYRNAKYQGLIQSETNHRSGYGILVDDDLSFYASDWKNGKLNNSTVVYISHGKYIYGQWNANEPNGLNVFRVGDTVIIGEFQHGQLINQILIIFQKVNYIAILKQNKENDWIVVENGLLKNYQQLLRYIKDAKIPMQPQYFSLVKFLTSIANQRIKIGPCRSSQNCYFGFDQGLGIIFNPNNGVVSVGTHINKKLIQFGGKYQLPNFVIQGNFQTNQIVKYSKERPHSQIYSVFQKIHKKSLNFRNQYFDSKVKYLMHVEDLVRSKIDEIIHNQKQNTFTAGDLNDSLDYHAENIQEINRIYKVREQVYQARIPIMKKASSKYVQESPLLTKSQSSAKITPPRTPTKLITNAPASPIIMKKTPTKSPMEHKKRCKKKSEPVFQAIDTDNQIKGKKSGIYSQFKRSDATPTKRSIKQKIQHRRERSPGLIKYLPEEGDYSSKQLEPRENVSSKQYFHEKTAQNVPAFNYQPSDNYEQDSMKKYLDYKQEKKRVRGLDRQPQKQVIKGPRYEDLSDRRKRILNQFKQLNRQSQISVSPTPKALNHVKYKKQTKYLNRENLEDPISSADSGYRRVSQKNYGKYRQETCQQMIPLSIKPGSKRFQLQPQQSPAHILKSFNRENLGMDKKRLEKNRYADYPEQMSPVQYYRKQRQNYPQVPNFQVEPHAQPLPNFGKKQSYHEQRDRTPGRKRPYKYYFD